MLLLLQLQIVQKVAHGNSSTASKLQTARNIAISGAVKGSANFDGSGNVTINTTQNNIFVLSGSLSSGNNLEINYPTGLTKDNCVCISAMFQNPSSGMWGLAGGNFSSSSYVLGSIPAKVSLATKINVEIRNIQITDGNEQTVYASSSPSANFNYKIILMKIS